MLLRVIISAQDIRKLRLDSVPDSVDGLKLVLKNKLQLRSSFDLQYEDEDFKDFCNLTCVDDLPKDKIAKEFTRLTSMDINKFYEGLDSHLHKLLQLFRLKHFEEVQDMTSLMESLDKDASNQRKRAAALQGLPWYMKENPSTLMKRCEPTDPGEDFIKGMVIGILLAVEDVKEPLPVSYNDVAIVIEEKIVMRHLGDVPNAFVNLMGLLYMLNLDYPKEMKYTFEVIQRLFMGIGSEMCTPRVHSLKNKLLS